MGGDEKASFPSGRHNPGGGRGAHRLQDGALQGPKRPRVDLVPQDLGLRDTLGADDEEVRIRWLQLKTVESLVDTILGRQVYTLHAVSPLDPISHKGQDGKTLFTEYPVDVDFEVAFEDLYVFFQSVLEEGRVFFIRSFRARAGEVASAPLRVQAVVSSAIFE